MSDPLRDLLRDLTGRQPEVADWPGRVRRRVGVRRRRQRALTVSAAVALVAVSAGGVVLASAPRAPDALVGAPSPSSSPSPVATAPPSAPAPETPSASAPPSGQAAPSAQPEPSAPSSPAPGPSAAAEPSAAAPAESPSYPPFGSQDIVITAQARSERPAVGEEWVLDITVTGFAESPPYLQEPCIDSPGRCQYAAFSCVPRQSSSPPPARAQRIERSVRHTFTTAGRHEVRLLAESGCSYYQGRDELLVVVEVVEQEPAPSPSPS